MSNETTTPETLNTVGKYDDEMIVGLFENFLEAGGSPKVTEFKRHIDALIKSKVKPLCSGRGASASSDGASWRDVQKAHFAGRGAKWVKIPLEQIEPALQKFEEDGIDCTNYRAWTTEAGFAWIRYSGPRVDKTGNTTIAMAAFEVRTGGSKIDHPKQLHLRYNLELLEGIEFLDATPHAKGLEVIAPKPDPVSEEPVSEEPVIDEAEDENVQELSAYELDPLDDGGSAWAEETPLDPEDFNELLDEAGLSAEVEDEDDDIYGAC